MSERKTKLPMKPCMICGELFQPSKINHNCCSQKCRKKHFREQNRIYSAEHAARERANNKAKAKTNYDRIIEIDAAAKKEGLTYGQYVAKYMGRKA